MRESGCLDLESLCIVSESVVWKIRLDITVLNHEGNVAECASVAGLAALAHFRRPDVTLKGDEVKVSESNRIRSLCLDGMRSRHILSFH